MKKYDGSRAFISTILLAFVLCALLGLLEALVQLSSAAHIMAPLSGGGVLRKIMPFLTLYGWAGVLLALLFWGPAVLITRRREDGFGRAMALTTAAAFSAPLVIQVGFLLRRLFQRSLWNANETLIVVLVLGIVYLLLTAGVTRVLLAGRWYGGRRFTAAALIVMILLTFTWPDIRAEGHRRRLPAAGDIQSARADAPNIILITIDALRRDALQAHTPAFDAFKARSLSFENTWSPSSWTLPAMSGLMTGLTPRALGITRDHGIPLSAGTLAESAAAAGYYTAANLTNPFLRADFGFDQGYHDFEHSLVIEPLLPAASSLLVRGINHFLLRYVDVEDAGIVLDKSRQTLEQCAAQPQPFLFWTHLMDTHMPYRQHDPEILGRRAYVSTVPDHELFTATALPVPSLTYLREHGAEIPQDIQDAVRSLYVDEVTYVDARLGLLFADLQAQDLFDDALIIITSDHGEEFFEHGGFEHGHTLMPEVTGVPLLVHLPGDALAGTVIDEDCSLLDLYPSLCRLLGWPVPEDVAGCADLLTRSDAACGSTIDQPSVAENMLYTANHLSARAWPWLRYQYPEQAPLWFNLQDDPLALTPLVSPESAENLEANMDRLLDEWEAYESRFHQEREAAEGPSSDVKRQLQSLGY
jgi:arylsulfatase A-like enzyme